MNNDLISRRALKKEINEYHLFYFNLNQIETIINNAPTVELTEAERPKGEWIIDQEGNDYSCTFVTCPFCGERHCCKMNFCGNCGADMRGNNNG